MDIYDHAELKGLSLNQLMDFTTDTNPLGPSNKAKNAVRKKVRRLWHPPDGKSRHLKKLLCAMENISEEKIIIGPDPVYTVSVLLKITCPETALIPSPASDAYKKLLKDQNSEDQTLPPPQRKRVCLRYRKIYQGNKGR